MKLKIFVLLGCLLATMTFTSCSGKDGINGEQGIQGEPGKNGTNGNPGEDGDNGINCWDLDADGVNDDSEDINGDDKFDSLDCQGQDGDAGLNGEDGNANVRRGTLPLEDPDINDNIFSFTLHDQALGLGITQQEIDNYVFFFYIKDGLGITHQSGSRIPYNGADRYTRTIILSEGEGRCLFYNLSDDSPYFDWDANDALDIFIVVAMEVATDNKDIQSDPIKMLKAAGVNIGNYHEVAAYFGLKE